MKITDANVSLASKYHSSKQFLTKESLKFWVEFQPRNETGKTNPTQIRSTEMTPFASGGSGLFALDLNRAQVINCGVELIGVVTGNGCDELFQYDNRATAGLMKLNRVFGRGYGP